MMICCRMQVRLQATFRLHSLMYIIRHHIVGYAGSVPAFDCGAYYSDIRSALTDAITNVVQNNADIDGEMNNAQETLEFNIEN